MSSEALQSLRDRLLALAWRSARARAAPGGLPRACRGAARGESLRDIPTIDLVEERANDHAGWLSRHEPKHPLSAQSAATRRHHSVFEQLAATAAAARARIKAEKLTRK
jgi:hypothetical protein